MRLTSSTIKQLIKEELQSFLQEYNPSVKVSNKPTSEKTKAAIKGEPTDQSKEAACEKKWGGLGKFIPKYGTCREPSEQAKMNAKRHDLMRCPPKPCKDNTVWDPNDCECRKPTSGGPAKLSDLAKPRADQGGEAAKCKTRYEKRWGGKYYNDCVDFVNKGKTLRDFRRSRGWLKKRTARTPTGQRAASTERPAGAQPEKPEVTQKTVQTARRLASALMKLCGPNCKWGPGLLKEQKHPQFDRILKAVYQACQKDHKAACMALEHLGVMKKGATPAGSAEAGKAPEKKAVQKIWSQIQNECIDKCEKKYPDEKGKKQKRCVAVCREQGLKNLRAQIKKQRKATQTRQPVNSIPS